MAKVQQAFPEQKPEGRVRLMIELPDSLFAKYEEYAKSRKMTPEQVMVERLRRCVEYIAAKPLYLNDQERSELEHALGHNFDSPGQMVTMLKNAVSLKVDDIEVPLEPKLQQRIRSRVFKGQTYESVVQKQVVLGLECFAGLRPY